LVSPHRYSLCVVTGPSSTLICLYRRPHSVDEVANGRMTEYELEQTLLDRLQRFMLDFSGELCFRARQLRLAGNDEGDCLESAIGTDWSRSRHAQKVTRVRLSKAR